MADGQRQSYILSIDCWDFFLIYFHFTGLDNAWVRKIIATFSNLSPLPYLAQDSICLRLQTHFIIISGGYVFVCIFTQPRFIIFIQKLIGWIQPILLQSPFYEPPLVRFSMRPRRSHDQGQWSGVFYIFLLFDRYNHCWNVCLVSLLTYLCGWNND